MKTNLRTFPFQQMLPQSAWRSLLSTLALVFGTAVAQGVVEFKDGGTHTISDASFQNEAINVSNNTTLIIEPGAVFGGETTDSGNISVYDSSTLTINAGVFGGFRPLAGNVTAYDTASVVINGGAFGGSRDNTGGVTVTGRSTVTVNGGTFSGAGHAGLLKASDNANITINQGTFGGSASNSGELLLFGEAKATIHGGSFGENGGSGSLYTYGTSEITIYGGVFGTRSAGAWFVMRESSKLTIYGGSFGGINPSAGGFYCDDNISINIHGGNFVGGALYAAFLAMGGASHLTITGGTISSDIYIGEGAALTLVAASFDLSSYDPENNRRLSVTFCSQPEQDLAIQINDINRIDYQAIICGADLVEDLIQSVNGLTDLHHGIKNSLVVKLNAALAALNADDTTSVCASLQDFINHTRAQQGKKLTLDAATSLIEKAQAIRELIGCS